MLAAAVLAAPAAAAKQPNVLVIVTDDQRADGTLDVMPATRQWFEQGGTTFSNAFATTPLCCPSRASLLTGNYAHNHRVLANNVRATSPPFDHGREIQRYLKQAGYTTGIVGKYLNGFPIESAPPGFDFFATHEAFYYGRWNVQGRVRMETTYATEFAAQQARSFLRGSHDGDRPWFLYVATFAPHGPQVAQAKYWDSDSGPPPSNPAVDESDLSDKPPWLGRLSQGRGFAFGVRREQRKVLRSADDMVASIMDEVRQLGEERDTLAIFTSDNGLFWGEHGGLSIKDLPYDPATKVPLLLRWPGRVAPARSDSRLAANIDIAPTILDAAGVKGPLMDGRSLFSPQRRDRLLLEYGGMDDRIPAWASIRTRDSLYTEYFDFPRNRPHSLPAGRSLGAGSASFVEYYDLFRDPFAVENLAYRRSPPLPPELRFSSAQLHRDMDCRGGLCP